MIDNVNVILRDMPTRIKGFTSRDEYGDYLIIINSRLNNIQQRMAYDHEIDHIENGHFGIDRSVSNIEYSM